MATKETTGEESTDRQPRRRLVRAVCECHTVLELGGDCYEVVSQSGNTYGVDLGGEEPICTCADWQHNLPLSDGFDRCKHILRCEVVTGERVIPPAIDKADVDDLLGCAVDGAAIHAGATVETDTAADAGRALADGGQERPEDCGCAELRHDVPCWPCFREGWSSVNPAAEEGDA